MNWVNQSRTVSEMNKTSQELHHYRPIKLFWKLPNLSSSLEKSSADNLTLAAKYKIYAKGSIIIRTQSRKKF